MKFNSIATEIHLFAENKSSLPLLNHYTKFSNLIQRQKKINTVNAINIISAKGNQNKRSKT